jgi:hypothetical protein
MTEFRHDPNSLADRLDQLLPPGQPEQIGSDGDPLTEMAARIASAPRPTLSPAALARIQAQITQAQPVAPQRFPIQAASSGRLALVAVLTVVLVIGSVLVAQQLGITLVVPADTPTASSTPTETATYTPSVTSSATSTTTLQPSVTPTASETVTTSASETIPPTATLTPTENAIGLPTATASPTLQPGIVVVEGPVQSINGSVVVIHDIEIEVDPNDPILGVIQVGDQVRIEGTIDTDGTTVGVVAITIVVVNVDVSVSPDGDVWRDTGNCSNPPPDWAPAHGWRARCEGAPRPGNSGGGDSDEDDDD